MSTAAQEDVDAKVRKLIQHELPEFMYSEEDSRGKIRTKISPAGLLRWCEKQGYFNYGSRLIRLQSGIAEFVENKDVYQDCLAYVQEFDDQALESLLITSGESLLLKNKGILLGLPECPEQPIRDTADTAHYFYKNGIVRKKRGEKLELLPFDAATGFIWKDSIMDREISLLKEAEIRRGNFYHFVHNTINNSAHLRANCTAIGYALHKFKDPTTPKAIIINDENLADNGKPEGGTGKGLYVKAIREIVPVATYNGKNSDFGNNRFAYQSVTPATRILFIDDVDRHFPLETLFSVLTDDMMIERKHKEPEVLKYEDSPKFILTTNYAIRGRSGSYARRRIDVYLNDHYGANLRPIDEFKTEFFNGWDAEQWNLFDNFMMLCLEEYFQYGLVEYKSEALTEKMLKNETSYEFWELMEGRYGELGKRHYKSDLRAGIKEMNPKGYLPGDHDLKRWIEIYAEHKQIKVKHYTSNGSCYMLT